MKFNYYKNRIWNVKSERGFTLIELVMVVAVAGVLSSALVAPFITGVKQATRPEIYATATYLAQRKMEAQRHFGYTAMSGSIATLYPHWNPDKEGGYTTSNGSVATSIYNVTKNGRTYNVQAVTEYVTHSTGSFSTSASPTEYIRITATVSNSDIPNNVVLWTILAKDFYDPDAN